MHFLIDILAVLILLFFFLAGWHKGTLLSLLGVVHGLQSQRSALEDGTFTIDLDPLGGEEPAVSHITDVVASLNEILQELLMSLVGYVRVATGAPAKPELCLSGIALLMEELEPDPATLPTDIVSMR